MKITETKFWNDPVGSQIIGWLLILILGALGALLYGLIREVDFLHTSKLVLNYDVSVKWIIASLFLLSIAIGILRKKRKSQETDEGNFTYPPESIGTDKALFNRIKNELLPSDGTMAYMHHQDFSGTYLTERMNDLLRFAYEAEKPEMEFLHPELDSLLKSFVKNTVEFMHSLAQNTFPINNPNIDANRVPADWQHKHPEKWQKVTRELNDLADLVYTSYENMIRKCRKVLGDS